MDPIFPSKLLKIALIQQGAGDQEPNFVHVDMVAY